MSRSPASDPEADAGPRLPQPAAPDAPSPDGTVGTLLLVATPLGNLGDVTVRSLQTLREVEAVICEDTRRTQKLLSAYGIVRPMLSLPAFDEARRIAPLLARLAQGQRLALVSDAGSVAISDPGQRLVAAALSAGAAVEVLPGPSAVVAALQISGLPSDGFVFWGFLPRKGEGRREKLAALAIQPLTSVLYESPHRLGDTLVELAALLGAERPAVVVRELTKLHEEVARGSVGALARRFDGPVRGEVTLVIAGAPPPRAPEVDVPALDAALDRRASEGLGTRSLAKVVAAELGLRARDVYQRILDRRAL